jgi:hypothetical protein
MLRDKMMLVVATPRSGCPEDSSKIEPTAAIAAIQQPANNKLLNGVPTIFLVNPI